MAVQIDPIEFEGRYGFTPQRYIEKVAVGYALAPKLAAEEAELAEDKAALYPGDWFYAPADERQKWADAENKYLAQRLHVRGLKAHQDAALQYAEGKLTFRAFASYFGTEGQNILNSVSIDEDAVLAAVKAALAPAEE